MFYSRRSFLKTAAATSVATDRRVHVATLPLEAAASLDPKLLPSASELWEWQTWMAALGPKYTGNKAHRTFVDFLATEFQKIGLRLDRERHTYRCGRRSEHP